MTILVVPFRALVEDMLVRLAEAKIQAIEWQPGEAGELQRRSRLASIVVVSANYVRSADGSFLSYAALLARQQILRRVVVDECHVAITADLWRPKLARLRDLRLLACQLVFLTATLPPSQVEQLQQRLLIRTATIVRARSTQRPNTQYAVYYCQRDELFEQAVEQARRLMREAEQASRQSYIAAIATAATVIVATATATATAATATAATEDRCAKGIVYCRSRQLCDNIAAALDYSSYHAGVRSRTTILEQWRQRGGLIVCTSALGVGVDIAGVAFTLHIEQPWSMIDFVQESGRARGQGKAVVLVVARKEQQRRQ